MENTISHLWRLTCLLVLTSLILQVTSASSSEVKLSADLKTGTRVTDSLKLLIVVSRHGNRGGTSDYPYDPFPISNNTFWPYGINGLTTNGRKEMYKLGSKIRTLYDGYLNQMFFPDELYAASTAEERTLMSGESFLAGLYPPTGFQLWNKKVKWQPTPVYSNSSDMTPYVLGCPKFVLNLKGIVVSFLEEYKATLDKMIDYYNFITRGNSTGLAAAKYLYHLGDKLISEETEGFTIPEWTRALYPRPLLPLVGKVYLNYFAGSQETARLVIGQFFEELLDVLKSKVDGSLSEARKIHYYSGHDASVVTLQVALGIPYSKVTGLVRPGSAIILELHQNSTTNEYYVQPLYIDGSTPYLNPKPLSILDCGTSCDFDDFVSGTTNFTGVNYEAECQTDGSETVSQEYIDLIKPFL